MLITNIDILLIFQTGIGLNSDAYEAAYYKFIIT